MAWSVAAGAEKCTPPPDTGICTDNTRAGLGDTVTIRLEHLDAFVGTRNVQELRLILNENPLVGVAPLRVDRAGGSIQFVIERPPGAPEVWTSIIAPPDFREVHLADLAVGFRDGAKTADVPFGLVVYRRSAVIGTATVALLLLALIVWFCKSTSIIRVSGESGRPSNAGWEAGRAGLSLSRTQFLFWSYLVLVAFLFATLSAASVAEFQDMPVQILLLAAISGFTSMLSQHLEQREGFRFTRSFIWDILADNSGISLYRVQFVAVNLIIGAIFLVRLWQAKMMPSVPSFAIVALVISAALYLTSERISATARPVPETPGPGGPNALAGFAWLKRETILRGIPLGVLVLVLVPILVVAWQYGVWAVAFLWGGVCFIAAACLGVLFGIPKVRMDSGQTEGTDSGRSPARVNTELGVISDWLTKIIIGLALINLKDLPFGAGKLAAYIASGLGGPKAEPLAMAMLIYFGLTGLVAGYLGARAYFRLLSTEAGTEALALLSHSLEATLTRQIQTALRAPALVNYDGWLCFIVWDGQNRLNSDRWEVELNRSFGRLTFEAWLQADRPLEPGRLSAAASVEGGEDRDEAEFEIRFDCDGFRLSTTGEMVTVERRGASRRIKCQADYDFSRPDSFGVEPADIQPDAEAPKYLLWIMLFQQNRLVQTITLHFRRTGSVDAT